MAEFLNSLRSQRKYGHWPRRLPLIALCFGVVALCRRFAVHVERETVV